MISPLPAAVADPAPAATYVTTVAIPDGFKRTGTWEVAFHSGGIVEAREIYVLKPKCSDSDCDLDVNVQTLAGKRIATGTFKYEDRQYHLKIVKKATTDCKADDKTIKDGISRVTTTSLVLAGNRPAGTAVVTPMITGTRTIERSPLKEGCADTVTSLEARGNRTQLAVASTPKPTPKPTSRSQAGESSGSGSSGWTQTAYRTAQRYLASVEDTYELLMSRIIPLRYGGQNARPG